MAEAADAAAFSEDAFLGGRLLLRQPRQGHRAGSDAVLLAAAAPREITGHVLDVGAGVGSAGLALAALRSGVTFGLIENDPPLAALARENVAANSCAAGGQVFETDVLDVGARRAAGLVDSSAALVITNPPFLDASKIRVSPQKSKQTAHVLPDGVRLADWIGACLALLADGGQFLMIHRPEVLAEILAALDGRAGDILLKPVLPQADRAAVRLLVSARKGRRGPLSLTPPFILHEGNRFTPIAEAVHRGEALITW
jgi:tRNA1(Val) A37 N6-methylase TrmN6